MANPCKTQSNPQKGGIEIVWTFNGTDKKQSFPNSRNSPINLVFDAPCVYTTTPCVAGKQTWTKTFDPYGTTGKKCPTETSISCLMPIDCNSYWSSCTTAGFQTYTIDLQPNAAGKKCDLKSPGVYYTNGEVRQCVTDCEGSWGSDTACVNGKLNKTYTVTKPAGPGGKACPNKTGDVREYQCAAASDTPPPPPSPPPAPPPDPPPAPEEKAAWYKNPMIIGGIVVCFILLVFMIMMMKKGGSAAPTSSV